jgi:hypothetical protein
MLITPESRAHRILKRLTSFHAQLETPPGLLLKRGENLIGFLCSDVAAPCAVLTDQGAHLLEGQSWRFFRYEEIDVQFPNKRTPGAPLTLRTPEGTFSLLPGNSDVWEIGRYFMRCAEDSRAP